MIGNRIKYRSWQAWKMEYGEEEGIVVDAWTETKGTVKGDVFILIGDVKGNINSRRMYKVEKTLKHTGVKIYEDIWASLLVEVLEVFDLNKQTV